MTSNVSLESVKKAVFFPFRGEKWGSKVLIGSALSFGSFLLVPLIPVFGYFGLIMKRIIVEDEDPEMPEWKDWGVLFREGIKMFGAAFLYMLPSFILTIGGYVLFLALDLALVISSTASASQYSNAFPSSMIASMVGMFAGMAVMMLGIVLSFVTILFIPPALGNMVAKGNFSAAFHFKEWWPVFKANLTGMILAVAISLGVFYLLYMVGIFLYATLVLCFLLPFAMAIIMFICGAISFSTFAVAYRDGLRKVAA